MSLPVVPNGYGFGMDTRAAWGGLSSPTFVKVTNLNDSGAGSLRAAIEGVVSPRVVIFETSGTSTLLSDIYITSPYITIATQTAPVPGFTLRGYGIWVYSHDILIQHMRIRPGDTGSVDTGQGIRAGVYEGGAYNLVIDHCSISWTCDEGTIVAFTSAGVPTPTEANVSFWRCIMAEALNFTPREPISEGKGLAVNYDTWNASALQSLYASTANRLPLCKGNTKVCFQNNLIYNWAYNPPATFVDPVEDGIQNGPFYISLNGNHYRTGPSWDPSGAYMSGSRYAETGAQLYLADNIRDAVGGTLNEFIVVGGDGIDPRVGFAPLSVPSYSVASSSTVYDNVLANAGARPINRDSVDTRVVADVVARTGSALLTSQSEVGGWPVLAVNTWTLTPPANANDIAPSGYTYGEEWLQAYAASVEGLSATGTGAVAVLGPTTSGAGRSQTGTGAVALHGPGVASTGSVGNSGSGAAAIHGPGTAGTGTSAISGAAAVALLGPTAQGIGTGIVAGIGAVSVAGPGLDASGTVPTISGAAAVAIAGPTIASSGTPEPIGYFCAYLTC